MSCCETYVHIPPVDDLHYTGGGTARTWTMLLPRALLRSIRLLTFKRVTLMRLVSRLRGTICLTAREKDCDHLALQFSLSQQIVLSVFFSSHRLEFLSRQIQARWHHFCRLLLLYIVTWTWVAARC